MQELTSLFEILSNQQLFFPFQKELRQSKERFLELKSFVGLGRLFYPSSRRLAPKDASVLNKIDASVILPFIDENCKGSYLVFVDGVLCLELSDVSALPTACVIAPTSKALKIYGPGLASRFKEQSRDPFELLNLAHFQEGVVIYLPAKLCVENPLQILLLTSSDEQIALPRIDFMLGKESILDVLFSSHTLSTDIHNLTIASIQGSLDEEAKLSICDTLQAKESSIHFCDFQLKRASKVSMLHANFFPLAHALHASALLDGERAHFEIKGISTLQPYAMTTTKILAQHKARETTSYQHFKQILSAGSKSTFEGKIYVHPEALLTNAYQRSAALLLSDHAYAISRPNLEIFADDVKASHGATMATLREEETHYLRTRGLSEEEARNLLIEGFAKEIIQGFSYQEVQSNLERALRVLASTLSKGGV